MNFDKNCNNPNCSLIREGVKHRHNNDGSVEFSESKIQKNDQNLKECSDIFDNAIQNYVIEYYHNWRQEEFYGSIKEDRGKVLGYIKGTIDSAEELRVALKDIQHLSIIEVFKKFSFFHKDFQITDSKNLPIGCFKSKALHWNSFLLKDLNKSNLIKIKFSKNQILVKSLSGKIVAKCLFYEIKVPKKKIEKIMRANPEHYSCYVSIQEPSVEKKYVFGAILFYLGKIHLEFALNGGNLPAG